MKAKTKTWLGVVLSACLVGVVLLFTMDDCIKDKFPDKPSTGPYTPPPLPTVDDVLTVIPDPAFLQYCKEQMGSWDKNDDGKLSPEEAAAIETLYIYQSSEGAAASLEGLQYFTGLTSLSCSFHTLTSLDVSRLTLLKSLNCSTNKLTSLDVSKNTALETLACDWNELTQLNLSNNPNLTQLNCSNNQLTALDLSKNTKLTGLDCRTNRIAELDLTGNTELSSVDCSDNQLTRIDVSTLAKLTFLYCNGNLLTSLDVSKSPALNYLICHENRLVSMDLSKNTTLQGFSCYGNPGSGGRFVASTIKDTADIPYTFTKDDWTFDGATVSVVYQKIH